MTTLYLCRHGIAADMTGKMADEDRPLTPEGVKKFRQAAQGILHVIGTDGISQVLTSPLLRARQTAEILAETWAQQRRDLAVKICEPLVAPGDLPAFVSQARASAEGGAGVLAVGHEPVLGEWIGELCWGKTGRIEFKKGAVAAVELAAMGAKGELLWLLPPAMLRDLR